MKNIALCWRKGTNFGSRTDLTIAMIPLSPAHPQLHISASFPAFLWQLLSSVLNWFTLLARQKKPTNVSSWSGSAETPEVRMREQGGVEV